VVFLIVLPAR